MHHSDHVRKRSTRVGRWVPVAMYCANVVLWIVTGLAAGAGQFLWLSLLAVPVLLLYLRRTQGRPHDS